MLVSEATKAYMSKYWGPAADFVDPKQVETALTAALPFLQGVKVKALTWDHHDGNYPTWRAYGHSFEFEAVIDKGRARMYGDFPLRINGNMSKEKFDTLEAAKAAAQADYEARILSAIEPAPSQRAQALEEAARAAEAMDEIYDSKVGSYAAAAIRAISSQPVADGWLPIESAPNNKAILVHYDDGNIELINADDNEYSWIAYTVKEDFCTKPTHWRPLPASPGASTTHPTGGSNHGE